LLSIIGLASGIGVVLLDSLLARIDDGFWGLRGLLRKDLQNQNRIVIDSVKDAPGRVLVIDPQFVAA
jgi:hypothetical protein